MQPLFFGTISNLLAVKNILLDIFFVLLLIKINSNFLVTEVLKRSLIIELYVKSQSLSTVTNVIDLWTVFHKSKGRLLNSGY